MITTKKSDAKTTANRRALNVFTLLTQVRPPTV
jgi:hypothetical protein